jgi:hypothetical protein
VIHPALAFVIGLLLGAVLFWLIDDCECDEEDELL